MRPGAAEWTCALDADGKLIEVESPEGHTTVYEQDAHGNRSAQRNAAGIVTRFDKEVWRELESAGSESPRAG